MQFTHSRAHKKSSPDSQKSFSIFLEEKENAVYLNLSFSVSGVGVDTLPDLSIRQVVKVSQGHIPPPF